MEHPAPKDAPLLLRLVAFALDGLLAVLAVFACRQLLPAAAIEVWEGPFLRPGDWALALGLLAWRDVVFGSSPGKWLLCLRLEAKGGGTLGLLPRLQRAPLSLLPLALAPAPVRARLWWRVRSQAPTPAGFAVRTACTVIAVACSVLWAVATLRPSISQAAARRLVTQHVANDALLRRELGWPLVLDLGSVSRRVEQPHAGTARFHLRLRGSLARQDMLVHARKVDGVWVIEELSDIEILPLRAGDREIAER